MKLYASEKSKIYLEKPHSLTERQVEVLEWLCKGLSNKAIGRELGISENTVRIHVHEILNFYGVSSRTEAAYVVGGLAKSNVVFHANKIA